MPSGEESVKRRSCFPPLYRLSPLALPLNTERRTYRLFHIVAFLRLPGTDQPIGQLSCICIGPACHCFGLPPNIFGRPNHDCNCRLDPDRKKYRVDVTVYALQHADLRNTIDEAELTAV